MLDRGGHCRQARGLEFEGHWTNRVDSREKAPNLTAGMQPSGASGAEEFCFGSQRRFFVFAVRRDI